MNSSSTSSSLVPIPTNRQNTSKHPGHCFSKLLHLHTFKNCYSTHWAHTNRPQQAKKPHETHSQSLLDLFLRPSFYSLPPGSFSRSRPTSPITPNGHLRSARKLGASFPITKMNTRLMFFRSYCLPTISSRNGSFSAGSRNRSLHQEQGW